MGIRTVPGTWNIGPVNLPDTGFTEILRQLANKRPSAEVATTFNNPLVYSSRGYSTAPTQKPLQYGNTQFGPQKPGDVLGANTFNGGGGTGATNTGGGGLDEVALAELGRNNRINSYKSQASNIRNQGQSTFDNIIKAIDAFRGRNKELYSNAGQEITNKASEMLGSNARSANDLQGEARARGRAMRLGDSSKFINQNKIKSNLFSTQGNTLARQGEEERANSALFNERSDQAQGQENDANTYLKSIMDQATGIENTGYDAGEESFANSLNNIIDRQRSLAAINPLNAGDISAYTPNFGGITNTLNSVLSGMGLTGGQGAGGSADTTDFANPGLNPTDIFSLLKKRGLVQ